MALSCGHGVAQIADEILGGNVSIRNVVAPIFLGEEREPAMVVRMARITTDYERKGFFRLGILPVTVLEDVTLEIRQPESLTHGLAALRRWLGPRAANRFEFRRLTIKGSEASSGQLTAGRARIGAAGVWEFEGGICLAHGANQVQAPRATLQIAGAHAGTLTLHSTPAVTTNFLTVAAVKPQPQSSP